MPKCPNCGIVSNTEFCPNCGTAFQTTSSINEKIKMVCPKCGTENNTRFCSECGVDLDVYRNTSKTSKCPKCGKESDSKFCPECGTVLETPREEIKTISRCPNCGKKTNSKFCSDCGAKVEVIAVTEPIRPPEEKDVVTGKNNHKKAKTKLTILISACVALIIAVIITISVLNANKYTLGDIKFEVTGNFEKVPDNSSALEEVKDSEWSGHYFRYKENDQILIVSFLSREMDNEGFYYMIYSDALDNTSYFDFWGNDAVTYYNYFDSTYETGKYFYFNDTAYAINVYPYNEQGDTEDDIALADEVLNGIFESVDTID